MNYSNFWQQILAIIKVISTFFAQLFANLNPSK